MSFSRINRTGLSSRGYLLLSNLSTFSSSVRNLACYISLSHCLICSQRYGISVQYLEAFADFFVTPDTHSIVNQILGPARHRGDRGLENVLRIIRYPHKRLHIGGNDANFTLRALLLLAVESYRHELLDDLSLANLELFRAIGRSPLPNLKKCPIGVGKVARIQRPKRWRPRKKHLY
ncbi:hypothetical protein NA56DRAFT_72974 [Hyaloscypha hepaticicola]|uniref:Gfd2/YDR514C-like C-terminal domain-containing protein n=1 Tax=Hyaloscypha hepaticicola TaxID=2082293 RepID=A0A2J6Q8Z3_9HELO|nr:hypothetical protein NA56DRAFT_72974 [Hyaloscypha hepaticicola]